MPPPQPRHQPPADDTDADTDAEADARVQAWIDRLLRLGERYHEITPPTASARDSGARASDSGATTQVAQSDDGDRQAG
jgi:hypothetical protein